MTAEERDPCLCAAGSFFFPGLGQVYCGRILRGIIFLIPAIFFSIPVSFPIYPHPSPLLCWWSTIINVIDFFVRVIATYDAYNVAKSTKTV